MLLAAALFAGFALGRPEMGFPWPNGVTYTCSPLSGGSAFCKKK